MDVAQKAIVLKKRGMKMGDIAQDLCKSERTINRYTCGIPHPMKSSYGKLPESSLGLSEEKAEILGFLFSEGTEYEINEKYLEFHKKRNKHYTRNRKRHYIEFSNTDDTLLKRFQYLMQKVYAHKVAVLNGSTIRIRPISIISDLNKYATFGSHKWSIPKDLMESNDIRIKSLFCRALFDGDGTLDIKKKEVRYDSLNNCKLCSLPLE